MCEWGEVGDEREEGIGGRVVEALGLPPQSSSKLLPVAHF